MSSYSKINIQELETLKNSIRTSGDTIKSNLTSYKNNLRTIKSAGYMKGISEEALERSINSVEKNVNSFIEYATRLISNINDVIEKSQAIEKEQANKEQDVFNQDPTAFNKGGDTAKEPVKPAEEPAKPSTPSTGSADADKNNTKAGGLGKNEGRRYFNDGHSETWYSMNEPGQNATARNIPGKHVDENGIVRDKDGYVCVAMPLSTSDRNRYGYDYYQVVDTSWGKGKIYDCGTTGNTLDIYTNW